MWMLRSIALLISLTFILISVSPAESGEPTEVVKATTDKVLEILKDKELKKPQNIQKRRERMRQVIHAQFDFEEMSRRSLARHWAKRSPEEKKEFISLFKDLLGRSYIKRIEDYTGEKIIYADESIDENYAIVKTKIITKKEIEIPINYRLLKKASKWSVYDVVIEGVSLISNYRTQFNKIIRSQSFEALIKRMKNKLEEEKSLEE